MADQTDLFRVDSFVTFEEFDSSQQVHTKIKASVSRLDELSIVFDYQGEVTAQDTQEILDKISRLPARALATAEATNYPGRAENPREKPKEVMPDQSCCCLRQHASGERRDFNPG